ncbi:MAG: flagellar export chaperone FliS [Nitrospirae bacterium]|nr:flagellar export chaperone FliS [Nitrospirota bacterium]
MEQTLDRQSMEGAKDRIMIISMLYESACNFTGMAKKKLETGDSIGKAQYIRKTSAIVQELDNSLNMDGGEIARNLKKLYAFVLTSLMKAEAQNDLKALDDAGKIIETLRDAWKEMQAASKY